MPTRSACMRTSLRTNVRRHETTKTEGNRDGRLWYVKTSKLHAHVPKTKTSIIVRGYNRKMIKVGKRSYRVRKLQNTDLLFSKSTRIEPNELVVTLRRQASH